MAAREPVVYRFRWDKTLKTCVEDPNGGIEVTVIPPDITEEENLRRTRQAEKEISAILGREVRFVPKSMLR